jgi:hypothetical protein
MTNQSPDESRNQWFADQMKRRSEYRPVSRKLTRRLSVSLSSHNNHRDQFETRKLDKLDTPALELKTKINTSPPNPFPFNRQHKSKVLYRSLNHPGVAPVLTSSKILSHRPRKSSS